MLVAVDLFRTTINGVHLHGVGLSVRRVSVVRLGLSLPFPPSTFFFVEVSRTVGPYANILRCARAILSRAKHALRLQDTANEPKKTLAGMGEYWRR